MRTKTGHIRRRRHKHVLKEARGYRGARHRTYHAARETLRRAMWYSRLGRRQKKRDFRQLWITRISAAARMRGISYSRLMGGLNKADVELNRKVLANLALTDESAFDRLVETAREAL